MGRRKFLSVMLGGILCLGNMVTLRSQSRLDSLQHLDEVVVTVRALPKEVIPVQQLAGEQLSRLSSHSVADALRYFSGLQIKDYGGVGGLKTVNIRSMGTNHVGVFYDGVELGNAQNGTVDLGRFSLDNMESVTLYNGQKSAIFQPAKDFGSAGSIYLQSRVPVFPERIAACQGDFQDGFVRAGQSFPAVGAEADGASEHVVECGILVHHGKIQIFLSQAGRV